MIEIGSLKIKFGQTHEPDQAGQRTGPLRRRSSRAFGDRSAAGGRGGGRTDDGDRPERLDVGGAAADAGQAGAASRARCRSTDGSRTLRRIPTWTAISASAIPRRRATWTLRLRPSTTGSGPRRSRSLRRRARVRSRAAARAARRSRPPCRDAARDRRRARAARARSGRARRRRSRRCVAAVRDKPIQVYPLTLCVKDSRTARAPESPSAPRRGRCRRRPRRRVRRRARARRRCVTTPSSSAAALRQIDHAPARERSAVVDPDHHGAARVGMCSTWAHTLNGSVRWAAVNELRLSKRSPFAVVRPWNFPPYHEAIADLLVALPLLERHVGTAAHAVGLEAAELCGRGSEVRAGEDQRGRRALARPPPRTAQQRAP